MSDTPFWERFEYDPRRPENAPLRAADRDRDVVNELLGSAYSDGRLDREEFDERAELVGHAKTLGQLPEIVHDLVATGGGVPMRTADQRAEAEHRYHRMRQQALIGFLMPTLICWVVWASVMLGGFPWPIFVTIATGARFFQLATDKEHTIAGIERSLVGKERRRVAQRERRERRIQNYLPPAYPPQVQPPPHPIEPGPPPPGRPGRTPPPPWQ